MLSLSINFRSFELFLRVDEEINVELAEVVYFLEEPSCR